VRSEDDKGERRGIVDGMARIAELSESMASREGGDARWSGDVGRWVKGTRDGAEMWGDG
jgi:hypothetical protein